MNESSPIAHGPDHARIEMRLLDGTVVVLEGPADFVLRGFDRIRHQEAAGRGAGEAAVAPVPDTDGVPDTARDLPPPVLARPCYIVVCEDRVRSVYALSPEEVRLTPALAALGAVAGERVYTDDPAVRRVLKGRARTLWRELEPEALAEVRALRAAQP